MPNMSMPKMRKTFKLSRRESLYMLSTAVEPPFSPIASSGWPSCTGVSNNHSMSTLKATYVQKVHMFYMP